MQYDFAPRCKYSIRHGYDRISIFWIACYGHFLALINRYHAKKGLNIYNKCIHLIKSWNGLCTPWISGLLTVPRLNISGFLKTINKICTLILSVYLQPLHFTRICLNTLMLFLILFSLFCFISFSFCVAASCFINFIFFVYLS